MSKGCIYYFWPSREFVNLCRVSAAFWRAIWGVPSRARCCANTVRRQSLPWKPHTWANAWYGLKNIYNLLWKCAPNSMCLEVESHPLAKAALTYWELEEDSETGSPVLLLCMKHPHGTQPFWQPQCLRDAEHRWWCSSDFPLSQRKIKLLVTQGTETHPSPRESTQSISWLWPPLMALAYPRQKNIFNFLVVNQGCEVMLQLWYSWVLACGLQIK